MLFGRFSIRESTEKCFIDFCSNTTSSYFITRATARVMNSSCLFSVGFRRPDYYQTPTLFTLPVKESHSPVIKDFYRLGTSGLPFEGRRISGCRFSSPPVAMCRKVTEALLITEQALTG